MILDLIALDNSSRVWIYQADQEFTYDELDDAREDIMNFLTEWTAHSAELDCYGNIFHKRFLVRQNDVCIHDSRGGDLNDTS